MYKNAINSNTYKSLMALKKVPSLSDQFYLAGGTAAAIQMGHRISVDLDFFTGQLFESGTLNDQLRKSGIILSNIEQSWGTLKGFLDKTQISFFYLESKILEDFMEFEWTKLASLKDIFGMKLIAVSSRGLKKDFIDLYYIANTIKDLDIEQVLESKYPNKDYELIHILKSLVYFEDAESDPDPNMLLELDWNNIKEYFIKNIRNYKLS